MTEQEQAQALARWLEQPAGTPPPEGLDPQVVEGIYAMRPELAPAPTLSADDILADFDFAAIAPEVGDETPGVVTLADGNTIPQTPITEAPTSWRSANRIAGIGVLMATAATLLLVALPAIQSENALMEPAAAPMEEVAAAPARSAADPIASVADEEAGDADGWANGPPTDTPVVAGAAKEAPAVIPVEDLTLGVEGDAVADAADLEQAEGYDMDFEPQQRARMTGEDNLIPEAEAALRQDAVVSLDEELEDDDFAAPAAAEAEPASDYGYADKAQAVEEIQAESKKSRPSKRASKKDEAAAAQPVAQAPAPAEPQDASARDEARPVDYDPNAWRSSADANTIADIDRALQIAQTEAGLGNYGKAAEALTPYVAPPASAGQYVAIEAANYLLLSGNPDAAIDVAQRGLGLASSNSAYRSQLFYLYGVALDARGNRSDAEVQWEEGTRLNRSRGR